MAPAGITTGADGRLREVWEAGERPRASDESWHGDIWVVKMFFSYGKWRNMKGETKETLFFLHVSVSKNVD